VAIQQPADHFSLVLNLNCPRGAQGW